MRRAALTPALPAVEATPHPRKRDVFRVYPWVVGGYLYGVKHAPGMRARLTALGMLAGLTVMPPALMVLFMLGPAWVGWARLPAAWTVVASTVFAGLMMVPLTGLLLLNGPGRRAYMTPRRDVVLVGRAKEGKWLAENFFAARPRAQSAQPLWEHTIPTLEAEADRMNLVIEAHAMNQTLATLYRSRCPGFEEVKRKRNGQVLLRRAPRSSAPHL